MALEMGANSISDCVQCVFMGFCLRGGVTYCSYIQFTANQSPYVIFGGLYGLGYPTVLHTNEIFTINTVFLHSTNQYSNGKLAVDQ